MKVLFQVEDHVETLWAEEIAPGQYQLDNSPFWAYGVSWRDVVAGELEAPGTVRFTRVLEKSGHRTLRLILNPPADKAPESQALLDGLVALGASYEGMHPGYQVIDVPAEVPLDRVTAYLVASGQEWEYADPPFQALFPDEEGETGAADV